MVLASVAFFACAQPWSFAWFALWRFAAGLSGGVVMVLAAPTVLPFVPEKRQGLAGGLILTGVALGIALSGTLVPLTLSWGLAETWIILGGLAAVLTAASWNGWPAAAAAASPMRSAALRPPASTALKSLYLEYGLNAFGLVPHMVFWVIFIAQGLGRGLDVGAFHWVLFGIGAVLGPVTAGYLADRVGFLVALRWGYVLQAVFVGALVFTDHMVVLVLSSLIMGAFVPVCVTLVLGRVREVIPMTRTANPPPGAGPPSPFPWARQGAHMVCAICSTCATITACYSPWAAGCWCWLSGLIFCWGGKSRGLGPPVPGPRPRR